MEPTHPIAAVFTTSTPTTRPDWCDSVGAWRVGHADRLLTLCEQLTDRTLYVEGESLDAAGHLRLWVGVRDNRHATAPSLALKQLRPRLRAFGLRTRLVRRDGRVTAIRVVDHQPKRSVCRRPLKESCCAS